MQERVGLARFEVTEGTRENRCARTTNASDSCFTGKEEDIDVGLTYFGKRYLSPYLNRWISADPLAVHGLGADPNLYAYVSGRALQAVDPMGLWEETQSSEPGNWKDQEFGEQSFTQGGSTPGGDPKLKPARVEAAPAPGGSKTFSGGGGTPSKSSGTEGAGGGSGNLRLKTPAELFKEGEVQATLDEINSIGPEGCTTCREWARRFWNDRPIQPEVGDRIGKEGGKAILQMPLLRIRFGEQEGVTSVEGGVGADRQLRFEPSPRHPPGVAPRPGVSPGPLNGQDALNNSLPINPNTARRVGIDYEAGDFVIFDETHGGTGIFHGHVRPWNAEVPGVHPVPNDAKAVLRKWFGVTKAGKIEQ